MNLRCTVEPPFNGQFGDFTLSFIQRCPLQGGSLVQALVTQT